MAHAQDIYHDRTKTFTYLDYKDVLNENPMLSFKTIGGNKFTFINPKDDIKQGYNLLRIVYNVATASNWVENMFMQYMYRLYKSELKDKNKQCQLTEYRVARLLNAKNVDLNVLCINESKDGKTNLKILFNPKDVNPWVIFYKSGTRWKLAVQQQDTKFYPLFTTAFVTKLNQKLNPGPVGRVEDLDDTCITEFKRKSTTSSRRRRNESEGRRVKQYVEDEKLARRIQEEYLKNEFGGAQSEYKQAQAKFYDQDSKVRTSDKLLTLRKIRPAPRRVSKQLSSLRRKHGANDALENRVYETVRQEFEQKSKSRRQPKARRTPVVDSTDEDLARLLQDKYNAGLGTPTRLKKK